MDKTREKEEFFNKIYDSTFYNLRNYVRRRCINPCMVDDILQEVYLEAFRHIENLETHKNYIGWIYKTAENKVKKLNYKYNKYASCEMADKEVIENIPADKEESDYVLYEEYRKVLLEDEYDLLMKKYRDGYSHQDMAQMTGNTVAGNKMRMSRIIKKLKQALKSCILFVFLL